MAAGADKPTIFSQLAMAFGLTDPRTILAEKLAHAAAAFDSDEVHRLIDEENADVPLELLRKTLRNALIKGDSELADRLESEVLPTLVSLLREAEANPDDASTVEQIHESILELLAHYFNKDNQNLSKQILQKLLLERGFNFNTVMPTTYDASIIAAAEMHSLALPTELSLLTKLIITMLTHLQAANPDFDTFYGDTMMPQTRLESNQIDFLGLMSSSPFNARVPLDELSILSGISLAIALPEAFHHLLSLYRQVLPTAEVIHEVPMIAGTITNPDGSISLATATQFSVARLPIIPQSHRNVMAFHAHNTQSAADTSAEITSPRSGAV